MITSGPFGDLLAECTGLPPVRTHWVLRRLRENGLISQGGRGRGGACMTARDAAHVLIALLLGDRGDDLVERTVLVAGFTSLSDVPFVEAMAEVVREIPVGFDRIEVQSFPVAEGRIFTGGRARIFGDPGPAPTDFRVRSEVGVNVLSRIGRAIA